MASYDLKDAYDSAGKPIAMDEREEQIVRETMQEFSELQIWRNIFAAQWEEVAELVLPTSRNTFMYGNFNWPGQKKTDKQVDATAMMALHRFGAILDSLVTPRNMQWHGLTAMDDDLAKDRQVKLWFEDVTRRLFKLRYAPIGNFASQNQNVYQSLGAFGNGSLFIDQARDGLNNPVKGIRYKALPLGETFFRENHQGLICAFIRWFRLTPDQAIKQFGRDKLPPNLIAMADAHSQTPFNFLHRVCPNDEYMPGRLDARGKMYSSYYVCIEGNCLVGEGGYRTFPLAATRYEQTPGEVYGRGPAMMILPAIKTLNAEKRTFLKQGHRAADPVLLTADDGLVDISLRPGALNKGGMSMDGKPLIGVLPTGEIQISKEMMEDERGLIKDAFLVSLFQILTETPTMTATEVIERVNEKGILIAPTIGRQQSEYAGPMIERELNLLASMKLLPPMPPQLREAMGEYRVEYTNPISRSQRAQEAAGFLRTVENVKEIVAITQDPSPLDNFSFDRAVPAIAEIQSTPESWMATPEEIQAKRQSRAQAQQQQAQIQALPAQAAMLKAQAAAGQGGGGQSPVEQAGQPQQPGQQGPQQ